MTADETFTEGFYKGVYTATDDHQLSSQELRLIEYVDETPPVITFEPELQPAVYDEEKS